MSRNLVKLRQILSIILVSFLWPGMINCIENHEQLLASFSGALKKIVLYNNQIKFTERMLDQMVWSYVYWPAYDRETKTVYFSGHENLNVKSGINIYSINLSTPNNKLEKLIDNADFPALSPDNNQLAFYRHPNQLWIKNLDSTEVKAKKIIDDMANFQPCVWFSNNQLIYINLTKKLVIFNLLSGMRQETGYDDIIPGSLSPEGDVILCGATDGKKIFLYFPLSNQVKLIKENKFRSLGTSFIWLSDGNHFLFTMQPWSRILTLDESHDLFLSTLNGKETHLKDKIALFGGISLN
jgi:hypothetical protein